MTNKESAGSEMKGKLENATCNDELKTPSESEQARWGRVGRLGETGRSLCPLKAEWVREAGEAGWSPLSDQWRAEQVEEKAGLERSDGEQERQPLGKWDPEDDR